MEHRSDLKSILPYLPPLTITSNNTLSWLTTTPQFTNILISISQNGVDSGQHLFSTIDQLRVSLPTYRCLTQFAANGFIHFFDRVLAQQEAHFFFKQVVPIMARLVLRLPSLLDSHYKDCDGLVRGLSTGLRLLEPQQPGFVFLTQELIAALLSCSFFCLFPTANRAAKHMREINMDKFFGCSVAEEQKHKIKCIIHYFEKMCSSTPSNLVSFERKVLSVEHNSATIALPPVDFWANSVSPLCKFKVFHTGRIEDHQDPAGSLEVDFADQYLGGIVLTDGCLQEEIRFVFNPELIAGMLFLPRMAENEAIEIVGAERFSNYKGYDLGFQYDGDHTDERGIDAFHRRKSRVIAIDALEGPAETQYQIKYLLREVNKAFCGFVDHFKPLGPDNEVGIVTGNWGCGVFGGDPEVKSMIQWVAASQASRPFISYYTFGKKKLEDLDKVVELIESQKWTVGDLWNKLCEYDSNPNGERKFGFFSYLSSTTK